ncbi:hypothetical protein TKK_0004469 [Trichogramma kaykai]|uniref:Pre-mRNA-splicing factor SLU7 n=1 Tax=Trichogramma kaykai TaxID=54128 RepID=A0ABD2XLT3_9HYME
MANHSSNTPVSLILKNASAARAVEEDEPRKKSREDWRKARELEEARKAGTAPAAVDKEGRDINPHIPHYISSAPWYIGASTPTLKHQRFQPKTQNKESNLDQCSGKEHLDSLPQELLLGQTEEYEEYSSAGNIIKRQERSVIQSKYEEKLQAKSKERQKSAEESLDNEMFSESLEAERTVTQKKPKQREIKKNKSHHKDEVAEAIKKIERNLKVAEEWLQLDERKRPYNSMYSAKELTEKEIEAYKKKRVREEDPMASL